MAAVHPEAIAIVTGAAAAEIAGAIVAVAAAGEGLRASTRAWFAEHAGELSIEASLEQVLRSYGPATPAGGREPTGSR
jgi:hypothetical protein